MTVGALIATALGLVVGIGGMWLAWRIVKRLPVDDLQRHRRAADPASEGDGKDESNDQ